MASSNSEAEYEVINGMAPGDVTGVRLSHLPFDELVYAAFELAEETGVGRR